MYKLYLIRNTLPFAYSFSTRDAVILAAKELKRCWLSFGSGFEKDFISTRILERRLEGICKAYISLNKTRWRGDVKTRCKGNLDQLALWEEFKGQVVYPLGKGLPCPTGTYFITRKQTGIKVLGKTRENEVEQCE